MSNLSTLPKGDSAWLLRKAIERIIQQVSVLETNIGSSTTGNSANTQIIFNDNGTLRGDAGLTYNKTTDLLTVGAATITGDLTVDTNVLKVDSANDYVGIGTASPVQSLTISGEASVRVNDLIYWNGYYSAGFKARAAGYAAYIGEAASGDFVIANTASSAAGAGSSLSFLERYRINNSGVHTWENVGGVAGTAMTLNANGLGIGVTPSAWASGNKFIDINSSAAFGAFGSSDAMMIGNAYWNGSSWIRKTANNAWRFVIESVSSTPTMTWQLAANGSAGSSITWTQAMTLDASGNLLVGATAAAGSASNSTKTVGGLFSTVNGSTASTASGAAVTMFTSPTEATFMVSAYIFGTGAPASYNAIAIVKVSGSTAAITTVSSATGLTISLSGLNVQVTQTSGSPQVIVYSAIRIS